MDLDNVVQPHRLQERLRESEFTRDDPAKQQQWFQLIKGIQGVGLSVDIGTSAPGGRFRLIFPPVQPRSVEMPRLFCSRSSSNMGSLSVKCVIGQLPLVELHSN